MLRADSSAPGGYRAPRAGEIFSNPNLANTFRRLAKDNKAGFYEGPIAQALIKAVSELGGRLTADDLREHGRRGSEATDPICTEFCGQGVGERHQNRPVQLWEHAPNGQGIVALMAIGMLEELEKADRIRRFTRQDHNGVE